MSRQFFHKHREQLERSENFRKKVEEDRLTEDLRRREKYPQWTSSLEREFFDRMDEALSRRERKLLQIEEELKNEKYPFKPNISSKHSAEFLDSLDVDGIGDGSKAFLERVRKDIQERKSRCDGIDKRTLIQERLMSRMHSVGFR